MSRIVLISARAPGPKSAGGVAVALAEAVQHRDSIWLAWSGEVQNGLAREAYAPNGSLLRTPLTQDEYKGFYLGYSNSVLWPTFHNRVDLALFEAGYFDTYEAVNDRFASIIAGLVRPTDTIWVHDYQFILLAERLRARGVTNRIGFFLHIPFPSTQAFFAIPEYRRIGLAFSAYDLVGLQTTGYVASMISTLKDAVSARLLNDGRLRIGSRIVTIGSFPIGIDSLLFSDKTPAKTAVEGPIRLIGVDRLDYTKGLPQKFRAFGRFLDRCPSYRRKVVLTQIAAPTRESVEAYADIRAELASLSGAINGRHSELDWVPLQYINRTASRDSLLEVYRGSRVGLVTPLADGMNLVAKEYVAAQCPDDPGVLVLSRFAGAAEELSAAVIVNPYDIDGVAAAIRRAIEMPLAERVARHASLLTSVRDNDSRAWAAGFLAKLAKTPRPERIPDGSPIIRSASRLGLS